MRWKTKAHIQRALQHIPFGNTLHYKLQRRFGGLRDVTAECESKIEDWSIMMGHLKNTGVDTEQSTLLEIGTGWYPTFPICLYIAGAKKIQTFDLNPLIRGELTAQCIETIANNLDKILTFCADKNSAKERFKKIQSKYISSQCIEQASDNTICYQAPADATNTKLPNGSIDIVFSNSVLEHVPAEVIRNMMTESMRILTPSGLAFHSVNCGDHYAYVDHTVNQLNYLQFDDSEWNKWNTRFLYQNRLRAKEFTQMARDAKLNIILDTSEPLTERLTQLSKIRVANDFDGYTEQELCLTTIDFIGQKPASTN